MLCLSGFGYMVIPVYARVLGGISVGGCCSGFGWFTVSA